MLNEIYFTSENGERSETGDVCLCFYLALDVSVCVCIQCIREINVMIAEYTFNGSIDKITPGFPFAFNARMGTWLM